MFNFSPDSATSILQEHRDELRGFLLRRINCTDTADDILQDIYLKLTQSDTCVNNPKAFLYQVAGNLATDYLRKIQREQARFVDESGSPDPLSQIPSLERQVYSQEQITLLKQAIAELSPRCREVFVRHKIRQQPYSQIMRELGIGEGAVLKHITKAMEHCRRLEKNQCFLARPGSVDHRRFGAL
jgi:RNA polymerase sigma factor (sigma-70 family)